MCSRGLLCLPKSTERGSKYPREGLIRNVQESHQEVDPLAYSGTSAQVGGVEGGRMADDRGRLKAAGVLGPGLSLQPQNIRGEEMIRAGLWKGN